MKVLVTYSSKTGNTKKLAEGIYKGLEDQNAVLLPIEEVEELTAYEVILIGYWVDKGGPNKEAAKFMATIEGKKVGLFATLGYYPDTTHAWESLMNGEAIIKEHNEVIGKVIYQGAIDEKLINFFKSLPQDNPHAITPQKLKRYEIAKQHPNEAEIQAATILFKERIY